MNWPPWWYWLIVALAITAIVVGLWWWRRSKTLARLRSDWGVVTSAMALDSEAVAEMWWALDSDDPPAGALDERTWLDLDFENVIPELDRTESGLGRQQFYRRLHAGLAWNDTPLLETLVGRFSADATLRDTVGLILARSGRSLGYGLWWITRPDAIRIRWWYAAFPVLALAMLVSLIGIFFWPPALLVATALMLANIAVRSATAWHVPAILSPMRQMTALIRTAERLARVLERDGHVVSDVDADVRTLRPLRRIGLWVTRDTSQSQIFMAITELMNNLFIIDANALLFGAHWLRLHGVVLGRVGAWVGDVDLARSVASLRAEPREWAVPAKYDPGATSTTGLWHPLVEDPVVNDTELVSGSGLVITGANMSGKSTYLRTVGVAAVLARGINTAPAAEWRAPLLAVRSLIGRSDDLIAGKSYYQVEADGVVELLRVATGEIGTLFLLDELLRGTNTIERLAAGEAVLRTLLTGNGARPAHVVIVATHDGELVPMLADCFVPWHFREQIGADGEGLTFDYKRLAGPADTRTAIALLEVSGAPPQVVSEARARAAELDTAARRGVDNG